MKKEFGEWFGCLMTKLISRHFVLPLIAMVLLFVLTLKGIDVTILKTVGWILTVLALGYGTVGGVNKFIEGRNGKKQ